MILCVCAGILWNLSSKDNLKQKLARETLPDLTEKILIPLSNSGDSDSVQLTPSEAEILYNTMGCLRCTPLSFLFFLFFPSSDLIWDNLLWHVCVCAVVALVSPFTFHCCCW